MFECVQVFVDVGFGVCLRVYRCVLILDLVSVRVLGVC